METERELLIEMKYKVWFEKDGKVIFGSGRRALLRAMDAYNSLNAAAKHLNMSYRAAWGRIRASEERLGMKLVELHPSGRALHLTDEARALLNKFDQLEREIIDITKKTSQELRLMNRVKTVSPSDKHGT